MLRFTTLSRGHDPVRATRLAALAALAGAISLAAPLAAPAQTPVAVHHHHHVTAAQGRETIAARISTLHSELMITPDQETKWAAVAQVMRDNEADMQRLVAERRTHAGESFTAVQDLKTYEHFTQQHVDGLKNLISSFETLYAAMPAPQQAVADQVFQKFGRRARSLKS